MDTALVLSTLLGLALTTCAIVRDARHRAALVRLTLPAHVVGR